MSKNLEILTNENFHLRKELEMLIEQNKGSTNQVEEYTEKITGLEVSETINTFISTSSSINKRIDCCSK